VCLSSVVNLIPYIIKTYTLLAIKKNNFSSCFLSYTSYFITQYYYLNLPPHPPSHFHSFGYGVSVCDLKDFLSM